LSQAFASPTVSVILPTFNRARYLRQALLSILEQRHKPLEIIVIDDGSTDDTKSVCAEFGAAIAYVKQPQNAGKSAAINRGLEIVRGELIWVMDDDDIATPDALSALAAPLAQDGSVGFTFGQLRKFTQDDGGALHFQGPPAPLPEDERSAFVRLMEDCFVTGQPCALIRRACFDTIGPIDESVQVSVDYNILLLVARRFKAADVNQVVLWQRQHNGARGPAETQYGADQRVERWMASDARLLSTLMAHVRLPEYLGYSEDWGGLGARETRRALFQKAVIAARKNLWNVALPALSAAQLAAVDLPLAPEDRHILGQMLGSRYGIDAFLGDATLQTMLRRAAGTGSNGDSVRAEIASRLTYWIGQALRHQDKTRLAMTLICLIRLVRWQVFAVALRPVAKRLKPLLRSRVAGEPPSARHPA